METKSLYSTEAWKKKNKGGEFPPVPLPAATRRRHLWARRGRLRGDDRIVLHEREHGHHRHDQERAPPALKGGSLW